MDDFSMEGDLLRDTLDKLGKINKWLGGNRVTIKGVQKILRDYPKDRTYKIIDLGCGHGDILRRLAQFGKENGYTFELLGVDANKDTIAYAEELSVDYPEVSFTHLDIFSEAFEELQYDIALSTLFLHHFDNKEVERLLDQLVRQSKIGVVINDLHRSQLAYGLFKLLSITISNKMIIEDGLTSILRAFKRSELQSLSDKLKLNSQICWMWAFRYQWIIEK